MKKTIATLAVLLCATTTWATDYSVSTDGELRAAIANDGAALPLHHSQRELESTPDYTDFSYDIRPTSDFLGELLRHSDGIAVLQPLDLREKMRQMIAETLKRY